MLRKIRHFTNMGHSRAMQCMNMLLQEVRCTGKTWSRCVKKCESALSRLPSVENHCSTIEGLRQKISYLMIKKLKMFLALREGGKEDFPTATYSPQHNHLCQTLVQTSMEIYHNDYRLLRSEVEGIHTVCLDKYPSVIYSADETSTIERFERQPLPDYIRWVNTSELHYLSLENQLGGISLLNGIWRLFTWKWGST